MPVKKSAAKAHRQHEKRAERSRARKRNIKQLTKTSLTAIEKKENEALKKVLEACRAIDKAVKVGTLHKNTGARKKSRLMKRLNTTLR